MQGVVPVYETSHHHSPGVTDECLCNKRPCKGLEHGATAPNTTELHYKTHMRCTDRHSATELRLTCQSRPALTHRHIGLALSAAAQAGVVT